MENTSDVTPGSKTKSKEMTLTQAMSCLEVAMKWSSGFKKVTLEVRRTVLVSVNVMNMFRTSRSTPSQRRTCEGL